MREQDKTIVLRFPDREKTGDPVLRDSFNVPAPGIYDLVVIQLADGTPRCVLTPRACVESTIRSLPAV